MSDDRMRVVVLAATLLGACVGPDDDGARCPPAYPVERGGNCYPAEDAAAPADAGRTDGATADGDGGGAGDAGGVVVGDGGPARDGAIDCMRTHPRVEGDRRFCDPGFCYCAASDACSPMAVAEGCCTGPLMCY